VRWWWSDILLFPKHLFTIPSEWLKEKKGKGKLDSQGGTESQHRTPSRVPTSLLTRCPRLLRSGRNNGKEKEGKEREC